MSKVRSLPYAAACAGLAASLTACAAPTEFQSAEELAALIESHGFDCPDPFKLRDYYLFECGNVTGYWSEERLSGPNKPSPGRGKGTYIDNNQRAITEKNWMVYSVGDYDGIRAGNEAVDRIAEETNTKSFHAYW